MCEMTKLTGIRNLPGTLGILAAVPVWKRRAQQRSRPALTFNV
jgi:hypothetical protein